jgi:hypothetical protein
VKGRVRLDLFGLILDPFNCAINSLPEESNIDVINERGIEIKAEGFFMADMTLTLLTRHSSARNEWYCGQSQDL